MLLFAAALSALAGLFVAVFGQERRVRGWFVLLCLSAAALTAGLWVELNVPARAFLAARVNMTTGLVLALSGCTCGLSMCGGRWHRVALAVFVMTAVLNVATVWVTDVYFTGAYVDYGWGGYVVAHMQFVVNPALVASIGVYTVVELVRRYPSAHPLDRNRIRYVALAWVALSAAVLDYLPHFGVIVFSGPVSAISVPAFVVIFGYALLRFRLVEFRAAVLRSSGWLVTIVLVATGYVLVLEGARRWSEIGRDGAHVGAAAVAIALFSAVGRAVPGWFSKLAGAGEREYQHIVESFSDQVRGVVDEPALRLGIEQVCTGPLDIEHIEWLDADTLRGDGALAAAVAGKSLIESEVYRRRGVTSPLLDRAEVIVPLRDGDELLGALLLGRRADGAQYSSRLLAAVRTIANVFTVSIVNARAAVEIAHRHQLDRYVSPQLVESALQGKATGLDPRRRKTVTIFFSDLCGFTPIADRLAPDVLSAILNQYLSAMSGVALDHGGTIDKFIGDAVMVIFGAPVDLEPVAQVERALAMALDMHERLAVLNARWLDRGFLDQALICRMGLHTGEATVGSFGSSVRADYTAVGRAVNLASRLEAACPPGRILMSSSTWALVDGRMPWRAEARGAVTVKGFATPVEVVEVDPDALREATDERRYDGLTAPERS